jgi:hypothetical protein
VVVRFQLSFETNRFRYPDSSSNARTKTASATFGKVQGAQKVAALSEAGHVENLSFTDAIVKDHTLAVTITA